MAGPLARLLARRNLALAEVVSEAMDYLRRCAQPDGSVADDPELAFFRNWDSVNALRAVATWRSAGDWVDRLRTFLAGQESPDGLIHTGVGPCDRLSYCTETSSEYLVALAELGDLRRARRAARFLSTRQLPTGG